MRAFFVFLLTAFFHSAVLGTPQIPDKIIYLGKEYKLQARANYVMIAILKNIRIKTPEMDLELLLFGGAM